MAKNLYKNIFKAMLLAAPAMAKLKADIESGELQVCDGGKEFAKMPKLFAKTVEEYCCLRDCNKGIDSELAHQSIFYGPRSEESKLLMRFIARNNRSYKKIAGFLFNYDLLVRRKGIESYTPLELIQMAIDRVTGESLIKKQQNLFS